MRVWQIKKESEKRIRTGHPWVFSNDLARSPKGVEPGELIDLRTAQGESLGWGYGNPQSLIAFRFLSRTPRDPSVDLVDYFSQRLREAWKHRQNLGLQDVSFRWIFAEADGLPGLILDRFVVRDHSEICQVLVLQISTAGMQKLEEPIMTAAQKVAEEMSGLSSMQTRVLLSPDSSSRKLEGLEVESKRWVGAQTEEELTIAVRSTVPGQPVLFNLDFLQAQKTGFFLDQAHNIFLTAQILQRSLQVEKPRKIRVLDLFCYLGQWGTQLTRVIRAAGVDAEVVLADASEWALGLAEKNVGREGAQVELRKADLLEKLKEWELAEFDVVICDPPAFVKKKKDLPQALPAYTKINREAMKRVRPGGLFVSCSCSGLLTPEDFRGVLLKAQQQSGRRFLGVSSGGLSWDHPILPQFPEGQYLKGFIARVL